jgi:hypothetical protein
MCRHAGVAGYRLGAGRTINVPSISLDRPSLRNTSHYCKSLFKHGQRVATMKNWLLRLGWWHQQRIDGGYNVNCMFFSMHGVSKMLEWSIIRVRWANRRLGQCAGEWRSCEGFSPPFFCGRGCKWSTQRSAATRGCRGTAAHFYNHRDFISFFLITVIVKSFILM